MRILSVQQPWAWALVHGPKRVENRTWGTDYRGPLLVHAGKSRERLGDYGHGEPAAEKLAFGALVGLVDLVDVATHKRHLPLDLRGSHFAEGPVYWVLRNPRPLPEPIPLKGRQGLFLPPADLVLPEGFLSPAAAG